jgi:hypothetical protein
MSRAEQLTLHLPLPDFTPDQAVRWRVQVLLRILELNAVEPYAGDLVPRLDAWLATPCQATEGRLRFRAHRLAHDLRLSPWAAAAVELYLLLHAGIERCADVALRADEVNR